MRGFGHVVFFYPRCVHAFCRGVQMNTYVTNQAELLVARPALSFGFAACPVASLGVIARTQIMRHPDSSGCLVEVVRAC